MTLLADLDPDELDRDDEEFRAAMEMNRRRISAEQMHKFEGYAAEIFTAFGLDLNTPATRETPHRFIQALFDATEGYDGDPKLLKVFGTECRGEPDCLMSQLVEGPIHFFALCEHHAFPFFGHAYVGYIAHENIIGISKLTRLVRLFAKRFAVQERIGQQIADTLEAMLHPHGVAVYLEASPVRCDAGCARGSASNPDDCLARPVCRRPGAADRVLRRGGLAARLGIHYGHLARFSRPQCSLRAGAL
jgi:GTP cyclohydrolase I